METKVPFSKELVTFNLCKRQVHGVSFLSIGTEVSILIPMETNKVPLCGKLVSFELCERQVHWGYYRNQSLCPRSHEVSILIPMLSNKGSPL
jgi:hypothetical protein